MPPTFLYLLALGLWLCTAVFVFGAAVILLILPFTRRWAGPLASAMVGTFPGVFLAQVVTLPFAASILLVGLLVVHFIEPGGSQTTANPVAIGLSLAVALAELLLIGVMSLLGFFEGWRTGWLLAEGHRFRQIVANGPTSSLIGFITKHR